MPIPGTKRRTYLDENVDAAAVVLTDEELAQLEEIAPHDVAAGDRYPWAGYAYGDSPEPS